MSESIKINMPFDKDFEKYKYCYNWGRLSFDLYCIGAGIKEALREPEFYNKKEIK